MKKNFVFGTGTSAYQIEGQPFLHNKTISIWDSFSSIKGNIKDNSNANIAIDAFNHIDEDINLMKTLGIDAYRFSLSWSRIINKDQSINYDGLNLYEKLVDALIKNNIKPVITLYHWDLPQYLEDIGGWKNRQIVDYFVHYVDTVIHYFGNKVNEYITINEPQCMVDLGYIKGEHAPGKRVSVKEGLIIVHNILLAHGASFKLIKKFNSNIKVGLASTNNIPVPYYSKNESLAEKEFFKLTYGNFYCTSLYLDPIFKGDYPEEYYILYKGMLDFIQDGDLAIIKSSNDYCYHNTYSGYYIDKQIDLKVGSLPWLKILPETLYYTIKYLYKRYHTPIVISENGYCQDDTIINNKINDTERGDYIKSYFKQLEKAMNEGYIVEGYYYWSIFDNFEWAEGLSKRFGLVYIDYINQKRIPKESFYVYQNLIKDFKNK